MVMGWNSNYREEPPWQIRWGLRLLILILISLFIQIPKEGIVTESYFEDRIVHKRDIKFYENVTDKRIEGNDAYRKPYSEGGENLRLIISISSTEELRLTVESINGFEVDEYKRVFYYNDTIEGPSLNIKLKNHLDAGGTAILSGSITIIHEYDELEPVELFREVNGTVWRHLWELNDSRPRGVGD